jgi:hypothetical protein
MVRHLMHPEVALLEPQSHGCAEAKRWLVGDGYPLVNVYQKLMGKLGKMVIYSGFTH